jgi:hypothetical protein
MVAVAEAVQAPLVRAAQERQAALAAQERQVHIVVLL